MIFVCNLTPAAGPSTLLGMPNLSSSTNNNLNEKKNANQHRCRALTINLLIYFLFCFLIEDKTPHFICTNSTFIICSFRLRITCYCFAFEKWYLLNFSISLTKIDDDSRKLFLALDNWCTARILIKLIQKGLTALKNCV